MDKIKYSIPEGYVSPYLRRPLRSLADALAERKPSASIAARSSTAKVQSRKQPVYQAADESHPQT